MTPARPPLPVFGLLSVGLLALLLFNSIHDVDIFWQVRLGELTLAAGARPPTEPFVAGREADPLVTYYWLSQVLFGAAHRAGGWRAVLALDAAAWLGAFWVVARSVLPSARTPAARALPLLLAFTATVLYASARAQTFGLLGFGLLVVLVRSRLVLGWKLALGAALLVVWQNAHPSVAAGAALLAARAAAGWVAWYRGSAPRPWADTGLLAVCPLAMLAQPMGVRVFEVAAYNAEIAVALGIGEWLPAWAPDNRRMATPVALAVALTAALVAARPRTRPAAADVAAAAVFAGLALVSFRFVLFWAVAMIPVWAAYLASDGPPLPASWRNRVVVLAGALVALGVVVVARPPVFADMYPFAGVEALRARGVRGTVFTHFMWGGVLADAGHPDWKVTHDGRYYLHPRAEWEAYFRATAGNVPVAELEAKYRPAAFFLRPGGEEPLIELLRREPGWEEVHADKYCVVFVRRPK